MKQSLLTPSQQIALPALLGLAIFVPSVLMAAPSFWGLPDWLGGVIGSAAVLGAFLIFWRAGALRARYLVLLAAALVVAVAMAAALRPG